MGRPRVTAAFSLLLLAPLVSFAQYDPIHFFALDEEGYYPSSDPIVAGGRLYGMTPTALASPACYGTIFSCRPDGSDFRTLHSFRYDPDDGRAPGGSLAVSGSTLYGVTFHGGGDGLHYLDRGIVFRMETDGAGFAPLHIFAGGYDEGGNPVGTPLLCGTTLYGMTRHGGGGSGSDDSCGTVYRLETDGSGFRVLHNFSGRADGRNPQGSLVASGTTLYGMTPWGGAGDLGVLFRIEADGSGFAVLHTFGDGVDNGREPFGTLRLDGGVLYGTTRTGGLHGRGTVFRINPDGSGFTLLHSFAGGADDGAEPLAALTSRNGFLYGTTVAGGAADQGAIFRIARDGSGFALLHAFPGGAGDGAWPEGGLALDGDVFYGTANRGGPCDKGVLFALRPPRISGLVRSGGNGLAGVRLAGLPGDPRSDALGRYSVTADFFWSGTVRPDLSGYGFRPISRTYAGVRVDLPAEDYEAGFLQVIAPNGGETLAIGSSQPIRWGGAGLTGGVRLVLFRNGAKLGAIVTTPAASGTYGWVAGAYTGGMAPAGDGYRVRAVATDGSTGDFSDASFTLAARPYVRLIAPNGGETCPLGALCTLSWTSAVVTGNVRLVLFRDGVKVGIIATLPVARGSYSWSVGIHSHGTAPAGGGYRVRVVTVDGLCSDFSDASFAIVPAG